MRSAETAKRAWEKFKALSKEVSVASSSPVVSPTLNGSVRGRLFVSHNEKTGLSVNVGMVGSCRPTRECSRYCYGLWGPASFPLAVRRYAENLNCFALLARAPIAELEFEADVLAARTVFLGQDFIRWNGVGDLVPGAVRLISVFASRHPGIQVWVSTRKPELAARIEQHESVHLMLSSDRSTKPVDLVAMRALIKARSPYAFLAYTQLGPDDVPPPDVSIVFLEHCGSKRAGWEPDPRACAATISMELASSRAHANACADCRRCFDVKARRAGRRR